MANRYENIEILRTELGKRYKRTTRYPKMDKNSNDTYIFSIQGDRLDNLAYKFYNDSRLWWVFAARNPNLLGPDPYFNFTSGEGLQKQFPAQGTSKNVFDTISYTGQSLAEGLNSQGRSAVLSADPLSLEFQQQMITAGIIDPQSKRFTTTAGNALAVTLLETFKAEQDVKDYLATQDKQDPMDSVNVTDVDEMMMGQQTIVCK